MILRLTHGRPIQILAVAGVSIFEPSVFGSKEKVNRDTRLTLVYAGSENLFRILDDTDSLRKREETIINMSNRCIDGVIVISMKIRKPAQIQSIHSRHEAIR